MTPVIINVDYVVEGADLVTFAGSDHATGDRVAVVFDQKPHARLIEALQSADDGRAVAYRAMGLTVSLDIGLVVQTRAEVSR
jgi:hypothetical protein